MADTRAEFDALNLDQQTQLLGSIMADCQLAEATMVHAGTTKNPVLSPTVFAYVAALERLTQVYRWLAEGCEEDEP